jgi:GTPase SAR1 family protein
MLRFAREGTLRSPATDVAMESSKSMQPNRMRCTCIVLGAAGAGKTSLVRRYFRGTFEQGRRVPTLGSDFYTGRVRRSTSEDEKKDDSAVMNDESALISLQVWDTAGRERKAKYTAALSDEFFRHADAAMLVYDATSSTSFSTLLGWYSDLVQRMKILNEDMHRIRPFPVLIVANKMDIISERRRKNQPERQQQLVPQRAVMGLHKDFKGKDSPYEYRVVPSKEVGYTCPRLVKEISSTYMATHGEWTTDGCYLDSVLNSEDRSHPDRDMVLLWCMRNGLTHVEASALDGTGVDKAMESLVTIALEYKAERARLQEEKFQQETEKLFRTNKALDLHHRYSPKDRACFGIFSLPWCK